jgi:hypothetical protein
MTSREAQNHFNLEPSDQSGRSIFGKVVLGGGIGTVIAFVIFMILTLLGREQLVTNPLLPLILLLIAFLTTFVGNMAVAGTYTLFFSQKYYDLNKTAVLILWSNFILFFILAPLYFLFNVPGEPERLFFVLAFHILFAVFIAASQIEFVSNPNYSSSFLIGNMIGLCLCFLVYGFAYTVLGQTTVDKDQYLLILLPSIVGYMLMPLSSSLWDKIYYKFYEVGNNMLYTPSLSEIMVPESEVNVTSGGEDDEINVQG